MRLGGERRIWRTFQRHIRHARRLDKDVAARDRATSCFPFGKAAGTGQLDESREPPGFFPSDRIAIPGNPVIAPSLVVQLRGGTVASLDDETLVEHSLQGAVESGGA